MVNIFVSWSGKYTHSIAKQLKQWLENNLQYCSVFISSDIAKGEKWSEDIEANLEKSDIGIICVTKESYNKPWLLYEIGALVGNNALVCPVFFDLRTDEINNSPILLRQVTNFEREDFFKLVKSINTKNNGNSLEFERLQSIFETNWSVLYDNIHSILNVHDNPKTPNTHEQFINENSKKKSIEEIKAGALEGNVQDQLDYADKFYFADGVEKNKQEAFKWYQKAAEKGSPRAQYNCAQILMAQQEALDNYKEIKKYYENSANNDYMQAQNNLGLLYSKGEFVEKNIKKAIQLFEKASEQGDVMAMCNLGNIYFAGDGVAQNRDKAFDLYMQAADKGYSNAQKTIGDMYLDKNQPLLSYYYYRLAAEQGNADACNSLGTLYSNIFVSNVDYKQAVFWFEKASKLGNELANENLTRISEKEFNQMSTIFFDRDNIRLVVKNDKGEEITVIKGKSISKK